MPQPDRYLTRYVQRCWWPVDLSPGNNTSLYMKRKFENETRRIVDIILEKNIQAQYIPLIIKKLVDDKHITWNISTLPPDRLNIIQETCQIHGITIDDLVVNQLAEQVLVELKVRELMDLEDANRELKEHFSR